ncbi:MAG: PrsW family intramembrane metalloprotease, partial [Planctomycetes bacterium]|nr:PrsW family intramembrane metalloprotease [Planctomycetota bacterium]
EGHAISAISRTPSSAVLATAASLVEETARLAAVGGLALLTRRWFNDALDGVTYGSLVGVGMSVWETGFRLHGWPVEDIGAGEIVRMFSHAVLGGIAGFPLGILTLREGRRRFLPALALCFLAALGLHFVVDWAGLRAVAVRGFESTGTVIVAAAVLLGAVLYGVLTAIAAEWSRRQFDPCSPKTLFGWPFAQFLGPPDMPDWCPRPGDDDGAPGTS